MASGMASARRHGGKLTTWLLGAVASAVVGSIVTWFLVAHGMLVSDSEATGSPTASASAPVVPCQLAPTPTPTVSPAGASVSVNLQVRLAGAQCFRPILAPVPPNAEVEIGLSYKNTSGSTQEDVVFRVNLPPNVLLKPNSTYFINTNNPKWTLATSNAVTNGGVILGSYSPGGAAYVKVTIVFPSDYTLACGETQFRTVGIVQPKDLNEFYNTADASMWRSC